MFMVGVLRGSIGVVGADHQPGPVRSATLTSVPVTMLPRMPRRRIGRLLETSVLVRTIVR
jgi:hypothetical protein